MAIPHPKGPILIATLEYPPQHGGISTYLDELAHMLPAGKVQILAPNVEAVRHAHITDAAEDMPIFRRTMLARWLFPRWLPAFFNLMSVVKHERPSLVVVSHLLPMGVVARMVRRFTGVPYVVICHGLDVGLALQAGGAKLSAARAALRSAELVVANSEFTAGLVAAAGITRDKIMVVHPAPTYGRGDGEFTRQQEKDTRAQLGFGDGFLALAAGRLVKRKGFDTVIKAVSLLKARGRRIQLVVAGDGPERKNLEELAFIENVIEDVRFVGAVPHSELAAYHAASDCFVLAPRAIGPDVEGFGIVFLDAAHMGKPSVGTRTGGVPEAVVDGETGLLVPPDDVPALAAALERLMVDEPYAARLGIRGRARANKDFDPWTLFAPLLEFLSRYHS